jgi:hypothetical protein
VFGSPDDPRDPGSAPTVAAADSDGQLAEYIARYDPVRVLAEVRAKRAIVELVGDEYPQVLHLLAQPYADHPGFDLTWRP